VHRIAYCSARIDQGINPSGHIEQDVYLKALTATGSERCEGYQSGG